MCTIIFFFFHLFVTIIVWGIHVSYGNWISNACNELKIMSCRKNNYSNTIFSSNDSGSLKLFNSTSSNHFNQIESKALFEGRAALTTVVWPKLTIGEMINRVFCFAVWPNFSITADVMAIFYHGPQHDLVHTDT